MFTFGARCRGKVGRLGRIQVLLQPTNAAVDDVDRQYCVNGNRCTVGSGPPEHVLLEETVNKCVRGFVRALGFIFRPRR